MKSKMNIRTATALAVACSALLCLTACDAHRAHSNVRREYPDAEVVGIPGHTYEWVVRTTNGEVWYVSNTGVNAQQDSVKSKLIEAPKR